MKKLAIVLALSAAMLTAPVVSFADRGFHNGHGGYNGRGDFSHRGGHRDAHGNWILPLAIGAVLGGIIEHDNDNRGYVVEPAPAAVYGPAPYMAAQPVYSEVYVYDRGCNCYSYQMRQTGWR